MIEIHQSVSRVVLLKLFDTGTTTASTGKTVAVTISKNGGSFGNPSAGSTTATEIANGWYSVTLSTTDTNTLGDLVVRGTATGCDASERLFAVVDAVRRGMTSLPNAAAGANGGLPLGDGSGRVLLQPTQTGVVIPTVTAVTNGVTLAADQDVRNVSGTLPAVSLADNAITAAKIAADAITAAKVAPDVGAEIATATRVELAVELARIDTAISTRSTYAGADTTGTTSLLARLTTARASYLDNLSAGPAALAGVAPSWYTAPLTSLGANAPAGWINTAAFAAGATLPRVTLVDTTTTNTDMLTAAGVRNAVGLASANLDNQLADLPTNSELAAALSGADDATIAAINALNNLSAAQVLAAIQGWTVETGRSFADVVKGVASVLLGNVDGNGASYKAFGNPGTTRLNYTADADGNRTVTYTG